MLHPPILHARLLCLTSFPALTRTISPMHFPGAAIHVVYDSIVFGAIIEHNGSAYALHRRLIAVASLRYSAVQ